MARKQDTSVIKKYANRRLYNTGTSMYVTLENLADMVKRGEDFTVQDAKSGEDITHQVLTQIIFEQESKSAQTLMPAAFLRQLIRFYGDQMQMVIPAYLEQSMAALSREQESFRTPADPLTQTTRLIEEQVQRNTELFRQAMGLFNPFLGPAASGDSQNAGGTNTASSPAQAPAQAPATSEEWAQMRQQLERMQQRLDELSASKPPRRS